MISADEDALVCDLAETYGILNHRGLPALLLATLCIGLRADSRIKMLLSGISVKQSDLLLASIADSLAFLAWAKTTDARHGTNQPKSIVEQLLGENKESELFLFETAEEFEAERNRILGGEQWQQN